MSFLFLISSSSFYLLTLAFKLVLEEPPWYGCELDGLIDLAWFVFFLYSSIFSCKFLIYCFRVSTWRVSCSIFLFSTARSLCHLFSLITSFSLTSLNFSSVSSRSYSYFMLSDVTSLSYFYRTAISYCKFLSYSSWSILDCNSLSSCCIILANLLFSSYIVCFSNSISTTLVYLIVLFSFAISFFSSSF